MCVVCLCVFVHVAVHFFISVIPLGVQDSTEQRGASMVGTELKKQRFWKWMNTPKAGVVLQTTVRDGSHTGFVKITNNHSTLYYELYYEKECSGGPGLCDHHPLSVTSLV